jgi:hypothetical protein
MPPTNIVRAPTQIGHLLFLYPSFAIDRHVVAKNVSRSFSTSPRRLARRKGPVSQVQKELENFEKMRDPSRLVKPVTEPVPAESGAGPLKINFFEEQVDARDGSRRTVKVDPDNQGPYSEEIGILKTKMQGLEAELQHMRQTPGFFEIDKTLTGPQFTHLTRDERIKIKELFHGIGAKGAREGIEGPRPGLALDIGHDTIERKETIVLIKRFNAAVEAASLPQDRKSANEVWRQYFLCKQNVPTFLSMIPDPAWDLMWEIQAARIPSNPNHHDRAKVLAEDALSTGKTLSLDRKLDYIEGTFVEGSQDQALSLWEAATEDFGDRSDLSKQFWILGVRMMCENKDIDRAEKTANIYLELAGNAEARMLLPVMTGWAESGLEHGTQRAWEVYLRLRELVGRELVMADYDIVTMSFLRAGDVHRGLAVFRDMMLHNSSQEESSDSIAIEKKVIPKILERLQASGADASEINRTSLTTLSLLPKRFQNKYFYASWIKKLIGTGEIDYAGMVVELMYERDIKPDAIHVNGIIGGWLRSGNVASTKKAEAAAWGMIEQRIAEVQNRKKKGSQAGRISSVSGSAAVPGLPLFLQRGIPAATIETFSILVQHYLRRSRTSQVQAVSQKLAEARIPPNSYFINHVLQSVLRTKRPSDVWNAYLENIRKNNIQPDGSTYTVLWDALKVRIEKFHLRPVPDFPEARELFAEMMQGLGSLKPRDRELEKDQYAQIIRCFSLSRDSVGTLVALHALREGWGLFPDPNIARIIILGVARLGAHPDSYRLKLKNPNTKANIGRVMGALKALGEEREEKLQASGEITRAIGEEENLLVLSELLKNVAGGEGEEQYDAVFKHGVEQMIEQAKVEMGVEGVFTGDYLRRDVVS